MRDAGDARLALAAPIALLLGAALAAAAFALGDNEGPQMALMLLGPLACAIWFFWGRPWPTVVGLALMSGLAGIMFYALGVGVVGNVSVGEGGGLSLTVVRAAVYLPIAALVAVGVTLRARSSKPMFGAWLLLYLVPVGGALWIGLATRWFGGFEPYAPTWVDALWVGAVLGGATWVAIAVTSAVDRIPMRRGAPVT